jgi:Protein of unknown function (DUF551)
MTWQPIGTAPKIEDNRILLFCDGDVVVGRWCAIRYTMPGWFHADEESDIPYGYFNPTHWMPFPEPPENTK